MFKSIAKFSLLFLLPILLATQCAQDKNPVANGDTDTDHSEAVGLVISAGGAELVRYAEGAVSGQLLVNAGDLTPLLTIQFIAEDGDLFQPEGDAYTLGWQLYHNDIAAVERNEDDGKWSFHIQGLQAGQTTIVFKIFHGDHADFVSLAIPITVSITGGGL